MPSQFLIYCPEKFSAALKFLQVLKVKFSVLSITLSAGMPGMVSSRAIFRHSGNEVLLTRVAKIITANRTVRTVLIEARNFVHG
jgi:hypothetical protein